MFYHYIFITTPWSITPAFNHARICLRIVQVVFNFSRSAEWSILSKHFAISASRTHLGLYLMLLNIASIASWHPLEGFLRCAPAEPLFCSGPYTNFWSGIVGIPSGRFSSLPGLGIHTRRVGFAFASLVTLS